MRLLSTAIVLSPVAKSDNMGLEFSDLEIVPKKPAKPTDAQLDLFLGELLMPATKNDVGSMEHPLFSLSKSGDHIKRRYEHNGFFLEVTPSRHGSATIWDKDILIYVHSLMRQAMDRGEEIGERFEISAADLLRGIRRDDSGAAYSRLYAALNRLVGTTIETNIPTGAERANEETAHRVFALVAEAHVVRDKKTKRLTRILFSPSTWFRNQVSAAHLLTINPDYFTLESGLHRRLYELARKFCGDQARWKISLLLLHKKSFSKSNINRFRFDIKDDIRNSGLPFLRLLDYLLVITDDDMVHIFRDNERGRAALTALITPSLAN